MLLNFSKNIYGEGRRTELQPKKKPKSFKKEVFEKKSVIIDWHTYLFNSFFFFFCEEKPPASFNEKP